MAYSAEQYNSLVNQGDLVVPIKAAAQYAAHESSLFLGGAIIPVVNAPNGLVRLPKYNTLNADQVRELAGTSDGSGTEDTADINASALDAEGIDIVTKMFAARTVIRAHGNIDPNEAGQYLGNAVSAKFDAAVIAELESSLITQIHDTTPSGDNDQDVTVSDILDAVKLIRDNGEMGQLFGIVSTDVAVELMKNINTTSFAGGDYQTEAMRNGFVTRMAGVNLFQSSYKTAGTATIFSPQAFRIGMQAGLTVETAPRLAAVGTDVVCHLHAAPKLIDANRAAVIKHVA